jgi:tetratricopeptide (TPR) repeat protein
MNEPTHRDERVTRAVTEVESALVRTAKYYPNDLPPAHYARRSGWRAELHRGPAGFVRYATGEFDRLHPLRRRIEAGRSHAESLLVSERMNEVMLDTQLREELTQRALGILPTSETGRFGELYSCEEIRPRHIAKSASALLTACEQIQRDFGLGTALAWTMLSLAGLREEPDLLKYAGRLDRVFDRITSVPAVAQTLNAEVPEEPGERLTALLALLAAVRDAIWQMKPNRVTFEFLLPALIDNYSGGDGGGNSLGLALFDSIILSKLGFDVKYLIEDGVLRLEVMAAGRGVIWELVAPRPLAFVPLVRGRLLDQRELFTLTYGSLATMCFTRSMWDKAIEAYERTLELKPDSVETQTSLGACYLRKQLPNDAIRALKAALEIDPDTAEAHHQLGNAWAMMSDWPKAIECFKRALRLNPDMAEVYNNLGFAYTHTGNLQQAVAAFERAIEHRTDYYQAHFNLANLYMEQAEFDLAVKYYRETVRLEPKFVGAYYNLGRALYEKKDIDGAIHAYQKATSINPKHFGAWHNLGIAYRDKGETQKAVEALEKAVTINPNLMR